MAYRYLPSSQGDPGFLSSLGRAVGSVARAAAPFVPGPAGMALGLVGRIGARPGGAPVTVAPPMPFSPGPTMAFGNPMQSFAGPGPGTSVGFPTAPGGQMVMSPLGTPGQCPAGRHVNKAIVRATRSPTPGNVRRAQQVTNVCVSHRRMNVTNPRALRRALRRAAGFAKLARRFIRVERTFKKGVKGRKR